jgi:hypothetical protein
MLKNKKISGKRSGPPPKSGPNPHIPPVKMRFGGGADMGSKDRAAERASRGYGDAGGGADATGAPNQGMVSEIRRQNLEKAPDVNKTNAFSTAIRGAKMLGSAATFGASKLLDIPIGGMRLAKNIIEPLRGTSQKNLNDYSPARSSNLLPPIGQGNQGDGLCPDGSNPPCQVVNASTGKSIKVRGVKAAIRGTNFKGVF